MIDIFPGEVLRIGRLVITDVVVASVAISIELAVVGILLQRFEASREITVVIYESLEGFLRRMVSVDPGALVPLVLTQWIFILAVNLAGFIPGVQSPARDLSFAVALAAIAWVGGHWIAWRAAGLRYLRQYIQPHPLLLPFNLIGELSRTIAMALRLFGNMLSSALIGAVVLSLAGFLVPVPLMVLGVLSAVVQAYLFGALTLVFTASVMEAAQPRDVAEGGTRT
jgi:F-type H+-transporting ATPase subunit a